MSLLGSAAGAAGKKAAGGAAKAGAAKTGASALGRAGVAGKAKTAGVAGGATKAPMLPGGGGSPYGPKQSGFGQDVRQAASGPAAGAEEGGAKAAALDLGKSVAKDVALGAAKGAAVGGGAGALAGSAKGVATGVLKNETGRKIVVIWVSISLAVSLAIPVAFAAATSQIINQAVAGFSASNSETSIKAATGNGQTEKDIRAAMTLVSGSGIPWQIAASVKSLTGKSLNVPAAVKALDELDTASAYRDITFGARYSSSTNARKIEGDASKAVAKKVKAVWVAMIVKATGAEETEATTIYERALAWTLAQSYPACGPGAETGAPGDGADVGSVKLTNQQVANALVIMGVTKSVWKDVGDQKKASIIGIATAMQESQMKNIDYGDRDSLGMFQQRPSMGWGTADQIMDPIYSSSKFFVGGGGNRGLNDVKGWQAMRVAVAAQTVQVSGFPEAYAKWETLATELVTTKFDAAFPKKIPASVGHKGGSTAGGGDAGAETAVGGSLCLTPPIGGDAQKPIYEFTVNSGYGPRGDLGVGSGSFHYAQDLSAACDTRIYSVMAGKVVGSGPLGTYGTRVMIEHGKTLSTLYAHMPEGSPLVKIGDKVVAGQQIGRVGTTGASSGCHLHFETWLKSNRIDPAVYMKSLGVDILKPSKDPHAKK